MEQDLQESAIEKVKPKRKQSKKQLEAFEKARQKRKENIAKRKAEKAEPTSDSDSEEYVPPARTKSAPVYDRVYL